MLTRRARRLTRSHSAADDLVQETLLRLILRARHGGPIDDLPAYAMRTLTNQARMAWRRAPVTEELEEDHATVLPDAPMRLDYADTLSAIETLPRDQADLLRLVAAGETSPARLAQLTGLPQGTVMSRLARARARLRRMLEGEMDEAVK
jgi:RNA polymerase sigma-70 factor (ECF subfamily)